MRFAALAPNPSLNRQTVYRARHLLNIPGKPLLTKLMDRVCLDSYLARDSG